MSKNRLALLVLLAVGSAALLLLLPAGLAGQRPARAGRVIQDGTLAVPVAPPIRLTEIRASGRRVNVGVRFDADDSWLEDLNLTVENMSGKKIEYLEVVLLFRGASPGMPHHRIALGYGNAMGPASPASSTEPPISPGRAVALSMGRNAGLLRGRMAGGGYRRDMVTLKLARVQFEDGTGWSHGRDTRRDPNNPLHWDVLPVSASAASKVPRASRGVSFVPASFAAPVGAKAARRVCYESNGYDIIPCNSCGAQTISDNFQTCTASQWCVYKPLNLTEECGEGECYHLQYKMEQQWCRGDDSDPVGP